MPVRARILTVLAASVLVGAASPATAFAATAGDATTLGTLLDELRVEAPATVAYNRDLFFEGQDLNGDGCRTRQEVLIQESRVPVTRSGVCTITSGEWYSSYDGMTYSDPAALEMDHLVALKETWISGAYAWTDAQRTAYANDIDSTATLNMVTAAVNTAKSDRDPAGWLPPLESARCAYIADWLVVKTRWNLSIDSAERSAIQTVLGTCGDQSVIYPSSPAGGRPAAPVAAEPATPVAVYRFWSTAYQGHFFTADPAERDTIMARWPGTWSYEGQRYTAFATPAEGTIPLYRFWSAQFNGHFYTADPTERDAVMNRWSGVWSYEGIAYYVYPASSSQADTVVVSRFWSASAKHHFYTASANERDTVKTLWAQTWAYEGENFRVPASGIPADPPPPVTPPPVTPSVPANPGDTKNCSDFANYAAAKAWFDYYYPYYGDIAKLDGNKDGIPCESLPGAPR